MQTNDMVKLADAVGELLEDEAKAANPKRGK